MTFFCKRGTYKKNREFLRLASSCSSFYPETCNWKSSSSLSVTPVFKQGGGEEEERESAREVLPPRSLETRIKTKGEKNSFFTPSDNEKRKRNSFCDYGLVRPDGCSRARERAVADILDELSVSAAAAAADPEGPRSGASAPMPTASSATADDDLLVVDLLFRCLRIHSR